MVRLRTTEFRGKPIQWLLILIYALTFSGYALASTIPASLGIESRPISFAFRAILACLAGVAFSVAAMKYKSITHGRFWFYVVLFWILYLVRLFHDTVLTDAVKGFPAAEYWLMATGGVVLPALAFFVVPTPRTLLVGAKMLLYVTFGTVLVNMQIGIQFEFFSEFGRFQTTTLNPVSFGFLGASLVILAGFVFAQRDALVAAETVKAAALSRWFFVGFVILAFVLGAYVIYLSGSRGPAFGAAFGIVFLGIYSIRLDAAARARIVLLSIGLVLITWLALTNVQELGGTFFERISSTGSFYEGEDLSDQYRLLLWSNGIEQFLSSPWIGSGVEEQEFGFYPHNMLIESFMATGVVGGLLFSLIVYRATISSLSVLARFPEAGWVSMMYFLQCMAAFTSGSIWATLSFWAAAILVLTVDEGYTRRHRELRRNVDSL